MQLLKLFNDHLCNNTKHKTFRNKQNKQTRIYSALGFTTSYLPGKGFSETVYS